MIPKIITIGGGNVREVRIGGTEPLAFIGGPCAIESRDHALMMAESIGEICERLDIPWVYKSCYDKDCRSSPDSFHGIGMDDGLRILDEVRSEFALPVVSDISEAAWAKPTGEIVDMIQIPAYFCRPTPISAMWAR